MGKIYYTNINQMKIIQPIIDQKAKKKKEKNTTTNKEEYFISVSSIYQIVPNFYSLNNINSKLYRTELYGKTHKIIITIGDLTNLYHSGSFSEPILPTKKQ